MVESVTVFDEDITEDDMHAMLEWQTEQSLRCPGCGRPTDETTAVGRDDDYNAEVIVCHACAAGDRVERMYRENHGDTAGMRRRIWESDATE